MNKIKIKYVINLSWILLSAVLLSSCIRDRYPEMENATVQVTFMTKAISDPTSDPGGLEANEHMRTLRVIVARTTGEILYNVYYDIAEEDTSKTITFSELTVNQDGENLDFYAIANEDGTGYNGNWDNVTVDVLKNITLNNLFELNDGQQVERTLIPQTAHRIINVAPQGGGGMQSATIQLQFAVAKVRMTVINTSAGEQTVRNIKLTGVNTTSTTLFPSVPISGPADGTVDLGYITVNAAAVGTEETATVYAYFFENTGGDYILTADWGSGEKTLNIKETIPEIKRGTVLNIRVTLSKNVEPSFDISVIHWDERDIEVPAFE